MASVLKKPDTEFTIGDPQEGLESIRLLLPGHISIEVVL